MLGSAEVAEKMLQNLSDFAAKTPFELADVRNNAKQLLAMGVSAENIIPTMKALGDTASATGADMSRLAMNYGQVITQGKLTTRELKDFQVNGVPILDELAKNAGVTTEAMQNMISAGMIGANEVTKAFETMTSEGGRFADMMYTNSSSFSGLMANMMEQLSQMGERIGTAFLPQLKMGVEGLSNAIEENSADLEMLAQSVGSTVEAMTVALRDMANDIMEIVNTLTEMIRDVFNLVSGERDETMTGVTGTWTDLFYFLQQGFAVVAGVASAIFG